jgi:hypothetical protein
MIIGGREVVADVPRPLGDANNPMDQAAVTKKLHDLGRGLLSQAELDKLVQSVALLAQGQSAPLFACLAARPIGSAT